MSQAAEITYARSPAPFKVGEYNGNDILMFGAYRVRLGDFVYFLPHSGFEGTVSEEPLSLDDPEVVAQLVHTAELARAART